MTSSIEVPRVDFIASDLVQCTISVNNVRLFGVIQSMMKAMQGVVHRMDTMQESMESVTTKMTSLQRDTDSRLNEMKTYFSNKFDEFQAATRRELEVIREEKSTKMQQQFEDLHEQLMQALEAQGKEIKALAAKPKEVQDALHGEISALDARISQKLEDHQKLFGGGIAENKKTLDSQGKLLDETHRNVEGMLNVFEMDAKKLVAASKQSIDAKLQYLNELPIFDVVADNAAKEKARVDTQLDKVHKRIGAVEQTLGKKADQRDLEEMRALVDKEELEEKVAKHSQQIDELLGTTDALEKSLSVGLEKKCDRDRVDGLEEDMETLEGRLREVLDASGGNKWQTVLARLEDLDHYMQKLDRRKVGRSDLQRMLKRLRQQMVSDMVHEGAGGLGSAMLDGRPDGLSRPTSAEDSDSLAGRSRGGGGQATSTTVADAAFIRYRCLSCNKPTAKLVDESMYRPAQNFPPSSLLTTNPNSPVNLAAKTRVEGQMLNSMADGQVRQERKMDHYFNWVEGHAEYNVSKGDTRQSRPTSPSEGGNPSRSPSPGVGHSTQDRSTMGSPTSGTQSGGLLPAMTDRKRKKLRTPLLGSDNRMYQGLQEINMVTVNTTTKEKSAAEDK